MKRESPNHLEAKMAKNGQYSQYILIQLYCERSNYVTATQCAASIHINVYFSALIWRGNKRCTETGAKRKRE